MPLVILTEAEIRVLELYSASDGTVAERDVSEAAGGVDRGEQIVKGFKKRKLLDGNGITAKGREALAQPRMSNVSETPPGPPAPPRSPGHRPIG